MKKQLKKVLLEYLFPLCVGPYFKTCISQTDLDELNIEIIRNALYKVKKFSLLL